jgi:hypothetical protein
MSVGASPRRRVFGGVAGGGFGFDVGTDLLQRRNAAGGAARSGAL